MIKYKFTNNCHTFADIKFFKINNILIINIDNNEVYIRLQDIDEYSNKIEIDFTFQYYNELKKLIDKNKTLTLENNYCILNIYEKNLKIVFEFNKKRTIYNNDVKSKNEKIVSRFNNVLNSIKNKENVKKRIFRL